MERPADVTAHGHPVMRIRIGVSRCLLGENVRYDGGHKLDRYITDILGRFFTYVPVCPEVEYGLPVPREPMHLAGNVTDPRLVTVGTGIDHTEGMKNWARRKLDELDDAGLSGFIFKHRSPSSGMRGVAVHTSPGRTANRGAGIFAAAFMKRFPFIPVEDEERLADPGLRENFIERVFVYDRWRALEKRRFSVKDLVEFHSRHKLTIMAHSPRHLSLLGKLVAGAARSGPGVLPAYMAALTEGLRLLATNRKNVNVLEHIMGYFKKDIASEEKRELMAIIDRYGRGLLPLVVPVTLLRHYAVKYDKAYLKGQFYLDPDPAEIVLKNHA